LPHGTRTDSFITREFIALNAIMFLAFCNIAVFFQFYGYLGTLPIPRESFGLLIALFSVTVLLIRPIISPFLNPSNSRKWIFVSCCAVVASLVLYTWALDFWSMAVVRLVHGATYVVLATAVLARMVGCIPPGRSGQAFGLISVITVLPYAVVPPLLEPLDRLMGGFLGVLDLSAAVMALAVPLVLLVGRDSDAMTDSSGQGIRYRDVTVNLKDPRVLALLGLSLLVWTTFTPIFYFLKEYGHGIGVANPGWFFTVSTVAEISVRLLAGPLFDKLHKPTMLVAALVCLALGYVALTEVREPVLFYAMGVVLGLGWGVALPLLSSLMFDVSEPRFRALNSNLAMVMFQAGFFVGPLAGAAILAHGGYGTLYWVCAGLLLAGVAPTLRLGRSVPPRT